MHISLTCVLTYTTGMTFLKINYKGYNYTVLFAHKNFGQKIRESSDRVLKEIQLSERPHGSE